jgi:hypothetical protein
VAVANLLVSATLLAVTVSAPGLEGATYAPAEEIVPLFAIHVTALLLVVPCTLAENCTVPSVVTDGELGVMLTALTGGVAAPMVTVPDPDLVVSATLVAVTVAVPAVAGAVYSPVELIVPGDAFQLTDLFDALPWTVAVNWAVPPVATEVVAGVTETEVTLAADPVVTVTVAEADLVVSATLVAVTVAEPAAAGAVNRPAGVIVPAEAVQVTEVVAPCTFAVKETVPLVETVEVVGEITTEVAPVVPPADEDVAVAFSATVTGLALALVMSARLPVTVPGVLAANATSKL